VTDADKAAFALWLAEDAAHTTAMDQMLDMWEDLACLKKMPISTGNGRKQAYRRGFLAASMAIAASLAFAFFLWPAAKTVNNTVLLETAIGERARHILEDNSTVTLNTNSKILVKYTQDQRSIDLVRGEAFFEVAKNPERPFEVEAGAAKVTALGTAFNILRSTAATDITVTEGVVRVTQLGQSNSRLPATELLQVDEHLRATSGGLEPSGEVDIAERVAWQSGKLIAKEMPLRDLVEQLERYRKTRILITDADIAALTISGVFELDQPESILRALEVSLPLQVVPLGQNTLQLLKTSE